MTGSQGVPEEAMEVLRRATTGMVVDALAMAGIQGGIRGIRPVRGFEDTRIVGPAATVLFAAARPDTPPLNMYRAVRDSAPGSVLVIDAKGVDSNFTGDNQGECAQRQGMVGVVVHGGARDLAGFRRIGMPLYCSGSATRDEQSGLRITAHNVPIEVGCVLVKPGDIIVADEDGVVSIPAGALDTVLQNLQVISQVEEEMEKAIRRDASLEEFAAILGKKKTKKP